MTIDSTSFTTDNKDEYKGQQEESVEVPSSNQATNPDTYIGREFSVVSGERAGQRGIIQNYIEEDDEFTVQLLGTGENYECYFGVKLSEICFDQTEPISLLQIEESEGDVAGFIGMQVQARNISGAVKFCGELANYDALNGSVKVTLDNGEIKTCSVREVFVL